MYYKSEHNIIGEIFLECQVKSIKFNILLMYERILELRHYFLFCSYSWEYIGENVLGIHHQIFLAGTVHMKNTLMIFQTGALMNIIIILCVAIILVLSKLYLIIFKLNRILLYF